MREKRRGIGFETVAGMGGGIVETLENKLQAGLGISVIFVARVKVIMKPLTKHTESVAQWYRLQP